MNTLLLLLALLLAPSNDEPALRGFDPVALCAGEEIPGDERLEESWGSYRYLFASEGSRDAFREDPERYCIQWDGGCGRMGPLSGKGDPSLWAVHAERIYIFASDQCRAGFLSRPELFVPARTEPAQATAEARAAGAKWIARAVEAHGGRSTLDARPALERRELSEVSGWQGEHVLLMTSAGALARRSTWTPPEGQGERSDAVWVLGEESFATIEAVTYTLSSPDAREDVLRFAHREPLFHLWAREQPDFEAIHLGAGKLGDVATVDVRVRHQGLATTLHLDAETGLVRGLSWRGRPASGETRDVVETFSEWETVGDLRLPKARSVTVDGKESASLATTWAESSLLPDVPAARFRRP